MPKRPTAELRRCDWALAGNDLYRRYHDEEWGVPVWDDRRQFEFLTLESAQAGLSWACILNKREGYRRAFADFDPERVARFTEKRIARILADPGVVRNKLKVCAAVNNARRFLEVQEEFDGFAKYLWQFVGGRPVRNQWRSMNEVPTTSLASDAASKDLKARGFKFVGSPIVYAHMQATGMVNDHLVGCFRHMQVAKLKRP